MQIQSNQSQHQNTKKLALFNLGFRPFFLGAGIFAIISMASWMLAYFSVGFVSVEHITLRQWRAHEML